MNKIFRKNQLEHCKILINRSSCYISLLQYSTAIVELNKVLNIIHRQRNIAIINKESQLVIDQIDNLEFLSLVRRAAAYSFEKNYLNSVADYEKALKIKEDPNVKKNYLLVKKNVEVV